MLRPALLAALMIPGAAAARELRFVGVWDCGVATMTFTDTTYDAGGGPQVISTIEGDGYEFTLTFTDGYSISVAVNDAETEMQWMSPASGDILACRRRG